MNVMVTGAGGFIGLNIVQALSEAGHEIHAFLRRTTVRKYINRFKVNIHLGDIVDRECFRNACKNMDAIIHCAANTSGFKSEYDIQYQTNVVGTRNVIQAALDMNVKRLVFTSTTSTVGSTGTDEPATEETPLKGFRAKSQYGISKLRGEEEVLKGKEKGLEVIILNPAEVLGAFDYHFGWGQVILAAAHDRFPPFVPAGAASFCHALEVGKAHVAALTKGVSGSRYILAGADIELPEFFRKVVATVRGSGPKTVIPYSLIRGVFLLQECLNPLTKKRPPLDQNRLRVFYSRMFFSSKKAQQELGFKVRSIEDMITDCYQWYKANSLV